MQSGADGPPVEASVRDTAAWVYPYRSCPNPFPPSHLLQLGWITPTPISGTNSILDRPLE